MGISPLPVILGFSILLQLASAVLTFVLIFHSGFYKPWLLLSGSIILMAVRRIISFAGMIETGKFPSSALGPEIIALIISVLMFSGLILFKPAFKMIKQKREEELKEKELLVKQTHHHVKNDLQLLQSLVSLQEQSTKKELEKQFLRELELRIQSFSLLHEYIYKQGLCEIPFQEYLRNLSLAVAQNYDNRKIHLEFRLNDFIVDRKTLLYCGLIVNEALTNTYKYAFKNTVDPRIILSNHIKDNRIYLTLEDNGAGLTDDVLEGKHDSYGFTLLREIGKNPGWDVTISGKNGTIVQASFPDISNIKVEKLRA